MQDKSVSMHKKIMAEIDAILNDKRISYAQLSIELNIASIAFYNKYKSHGFSLEELERFLIVVEKLPAKTIQCIKCGASFIPKTKSVKRAFCEECKEEMRKKIDGNDAIRFKYPQWVTDIEDWAIRHLVEQEFHIDEETALEMSRAATIEEAKAVRSNRWQASTTNVSSVVYDTMMEIKF